MTRPSPRIEIEADASRLRIAELLEELRLRISPGLVIDQLLGLGTGLAGHGVAGTLVQRLGDQARRNPVACALIGSGVAWLALTARTPSTRTPTAPTPRPGAVDAAIDRVERAVEEVEDAAEELAKPAPRPASQLGPQGALAETLRAHPLVSAGIGLALGAAIGAFLPQSDVASRLRARRRVE
jgi:hypothetical protein